MIGIFLRAMTMRAPARSILGEWVGSALGSGIEVTFKTKNPHSVRCYLDCNEFTPVSDVAVVYSVRNANQTAYHAPTCTPTFADHSVFFVEPHLCQLPVTPPSTET